MLHYGRGSFWGRGMRTFKLLLIGSTTLIASGCVSAPLTAWKARVAAQHDLTTGEFWTVTGERRLVLMINRSDGEAAYCLEPLPDAASSVTSKSNPSLTLAAGRTGTLLEEYGLQALKTSERSERTQIISHIFFENCKAYGMGVLDQEQYRAELAATSAAAREALKAPSEPKGLTDNPSAKDAKSAESDGNKSKGM